VSIEPTTLERFDVLKILISGRTKGWDPASGMSRVIGGVKNDPSDLIIIRCW